MKKILLALVFLFIANQFFAQEVIKEELSVSVEDAVEMLETTLKAKGLTIFTTVDHQKGAEGVNLEMNPAVLVIFGNPTVGTALMNSNIEWSYELPLKIAIYEDEDGDVWAQTRLLAEDVPAPGQEGKRTAVNNLLKQLVQIKK